MAINTLSNSAGAGASPTYRFGKGPAITDYRTLRFKNYLAPQIAPPPASFDVLTGRVYPALKTTDPTTLFPIDGNDTYGDCTIAGLAHAETVYEALIGKEKILPVKTVLKIYFHLTGGADTGLNELDVLNYWRQHRVGSDKIEAFATIDPKNHTHVQQAISMFGGVYLGFQVQQNCIQEFNAHQPWTPGPLLNEGHAVYAVAYDQQYLTVLTWGNVQLATWAWWDECVDEAYALLPTAALYAGFAPGFNFAQLKQDLDAVAN
jgi:hypothetical protein